MDYCLRQTVIVSQPCIQIPYCLFWKPIAVAAANLIIRTVKMIYFESIQKPLIIMPIKN